jgi:hypothetical protein
MLKLEKPTAEAGVIDSNGTVTGTAKVVGEPRSHMAPTLSPLASGVHTISVDEWDMTRKHCGLKAETWGTCVV